MQQQDLCSPEDGHNDALKHAETEVNNKHLIVASCWFFSLHTLLTMYGHRNLKLSQSLLCTPTYTTLVRN